MYQRGENTYFTKDLVFYVNILCQKKNLTEKERHKMPKEK